MSAIHVCAQSQIGAVVMARGARSLVSLVNDAVGIKRPVQIAPERHLFLGLSDIVVSQPGFTLPQQQHVAELLAFVRRWDRVAPMVIHCYAGVSRSTAAAFIAACALQPECSEQSHAQYIRKLSPTATPNPRLVQLADDFLQREGRMVAAIAAIGRGSDCFEGVPFALDFGAALP